MEPIADHVSGIIRVFLVDDHEMVREGLKFMLSHYGDIEIVGEACTGQDALRLLPRMAPDVVLLDLQLPDMSGLEVLDALAEPPPSPAVLVLTVHDDDDSVVGAARAGARGYVLKHTSHEELAAAIRRVAAGGHSFGQDVVGALIRDGRRTQDQLLLTDREKDILRLLAVGLPNREIGDELYLSPDTVKTHLHNLYRKLGVESRAHAVAVAFRRGLVD